MTIQHIHISRMTPIRRPSATKRHSAFAWDQYPRAWGTGMKQWSKMAVKQFVKQISAILAMPTRSIFFVQCPTAAGVAAYWTNVRTTGERDFASTMDAREKPHEFLKGESVDMKQADERKMHTIERLPYVEGRPAAPWWRTPNGPRRGRQRWTPSI